MIVFVCGVCGSGKTTVGRELARALGGDAATFIDADDYHPRESVDKMRAGVPLDDGDRWPWLDAVADAGAAKWAETAAAAGPGSNPAAVVVVACSALKRAYRHALGRRVEAAAAAAEGGRPRVAFALLAPDERELRRRLAPGGALAARPADHVLPDPLRLLPSQLATLERGGEEEEDGKEWAAVVQGEAALAPPAAQAREIARRVCSGAGLGGAGSGGGSGGGHGEDEEQKQQQQRVKT